MSDQEQGGLTSTSRGAIEENRRGPDQRAASGPGDPNWSGISSGAEGVMPQGAAAGGSTAKPSPGTSVSSGGSMGDQLKEQSDRVISTATKTASGMADQASATADTGMAKAASGLDTLADTIRQKGQSMGGDQVGSMATSAADRLHSGAEMLRSQNTDQLVSELEALIRRRPVESLLVAAGAGFVLSKALR